MNEKSASQGHHAGSFIADLGLPARTERCEVRRRNDYRISTATPVLKIRAGAKCEKNDTKKAHESQVRPQTTPRAAAALQQPGIICSLGAHDVFTALIVEQVAFESEYQRSRT